MPMTSSIISDALVLDLPSWSTVSGFGSWSAARCRSWCPLCCCTDLGNDRSRSMAAQSDMMTSARDIFRVATTPFPLPGISTTSYLGWASSSVCLRGSSAFSISALNAAVLGFVMMLTPCFPWCELLYTQYFMVGSLSASRQLGRCVQGDQSTGSGPMLSSIGGGHPSCASFSKRGGGSVRQYFVPIPVFSAASVGDTSSRIDTATRTWAELALRRYRELLIVEGRYGQLDSRWRVLQ